MTDIPGYDTIRWDNDQVVLIDQRRLPEEEIYLSCTDYREVVDAIRTLAIRGAPAIGVAAAMAAALGALRFPHTDIDGFRRHFRDVCQVIGTARPTAVNLTWALERMMSLVAANVHPDSSALKTRLVAEAKAILQEDIAINRQIGVLGQELIHDGDTVLTHCNAGGLATGGYGTAVGVIRAAWEAGKKIHVLVDETRPILQGARLTAWEMMKLGIPHTLITDNAAAALMANGKVNVIVVGADRIAANGDAANKIGTYGVAVVAQYHRIPFYVAAPRSTFDFTLSDGSQIPIEERDPEEVTHIRGRRIAPEGCRALNLAFDVTPHGLISGIITEKSVCRPPLPQSVSALRQA
ncbi:S-methyl-5-thioribose-1-phosphate isomerase [Desulfobacca acetoxidans]|uniref:Methylthioribose-1-phosphate isomerase n=1 Tax=Desulfobacca acetoxidans (strain ATCC 700848 / DSM 11109 / ASRB2) TaxID=880072 RepID=F2NGH0_DESAR|nr:S-methyl-5-thioribose-1-phosphate isomerase [Desulfobacca acetoxidans]AEB08583.1 Methylthioribose-1-phosphate isomerase [Desulfobacca acetoxidans DSM 11109]